MNELTLKMQAEESSCRILVGQGLFDRLAAEISARHRGSRLALLGDSRVMPLWGGPLMRSLQAAGLHVYPFVFPEGEASKTREMKAELEDRMIEAGFARDSVLIALGGGVALDLGGYLAATFLRGIPCVYVPTTTLAMSDAAIGGKCAVDTPAGKNLVGCFRLPESVYMDIDTLSTLDERNFRAGLVEALKLGFVADEGLLSIFEEKSEALLERRADALIELISRAASVKAGIVQEDFYDTDRRRILNYGHTAGHALELASDYSLLHGEAVAFGIRIAVRRALMMGICGPEWAERQENLLNALGFSSKLPETVDRNRYQEALLHDKKRAAGHNLWVLTEGPASPFFVEG